MDPNPVPAPAPVIEPGHTFATVTDQIAAIVLTRRHPWSWFFGLSVGFMGTMMLLMSITWLLIKGTGIWGVNIPVGWGFAIINFVWWIGIGHAGTLISAILLLLKQDWRTSINRFAEAMDVFAVSTYATVSLLFWYVGLVPDLATLRDRARSIHLRRLYGLFALGWRGCGAPPGGLGGA